MTTVLDQPAPTGPAGPAGPGAPAGLAAARQIVGAAARAELWTLTEDQLVAEIGDALALQAQAEAVLLARVGEADARGLARRRGATSLTAWLRGSHRLAAGEASRLVRTGRAPRAEFPATGAALAAGAVHLSQAEVVVDALHDLDADHLAGPGGESGAQVRAAGEQTLLEACATHDPAAVGKLGRRLAELLDPDGVQARDEAKIRDHEEQAHGRREFTMTPDPYGSGGTIRGRYDATGAAIIQAAVDALAAPQPETPDGVKDPRTPPQRRYDAVVEILPPAPAPPRHVQWGRWEGPDPGHHPAPQPDREARRRAAGLRAGNIADPGPDAGLRREHHPRRPERIRAADRPRPGTPPIHRPRPDRDRNPGRRLRRDRLHPTRRLVPDSPPDPVGRGRADRSDQRRPVLPARPPPG